MTQALRLAAILGLLSISTTAGAQTGEAKKRSAPKTPALSADFVDQIRQPGDPALDKMSYKLLVQELARLERLLRATPRRSPERALLLRRLAEGYAELAVLAERERVIAFERARRAGETRKAR